MYKNRFLNFSPKPPKARHGGKYTTIITGGDLRGRTIRTPVGSKTHPMGSRERMALFNALVSLSPSISHLSDSENPSENRTGGSLSGFSRVLDCYCGSGALGLEALSRGAKTVVFVDNSLEAIKTVRENLSTLQLEDSASVIKADVEKLDFDSTDFDLVFIDPPYDNFPTNLSALEDLLMPQGILVLSHPKSVAPESLFNGLEHLSTKSYAAANLSFFQKML